MMKPVSRLMMTAAAVGMAFAPIAAQANTRAGDNAPVYTSNSASQPGVGRAAEGEQLVGVPGILAIIFAAAAVAGVIIILDDDDDQSPGT